MDMGSAQNVELTSNLVARVPRWHDVPIESDFIIVEAENQEALTAYIMGWSGQYTFPTITPVLDDDGVRKAVRAMVAFQQG